MVHNIALNFEDGVTRFIACGPDETVADASFRAGINIPLDCRDGACGTCKCRAESGDFDAGDLYRGRADGAGVHPGLCAGLPDASAQRSWWSPSRRLPTACRIKSQNVATTLTAVERLSEYRDRVYASGGLAGGVPARAVRQCHGTRDGSGSVLLLQFGPR